LTSCHFLILSRLSSSLVWAQLTLFVPAWGSRSPSLQNCAPIHRVRAHSLTGIRNRKTSGASLVSMSCTIVTVESSREISLYEGVCSTSVCSLYLRCDVSTNPKIFSSRSCCFFTHKKYKFFPLLCPNLCKKVKDFFAKQQDMMF
jgi:hypothetical protein